MLIIFQCVKLQYILSNYYFLCQHFLVCGRLIPLCPSTFTTCPSKLFYSCPSAPKKSLIFNVNGVMYYFPHLMLFCKGVIVSLMGKILTSTKWKQQLECNIFFQVVKKIILQFGFICCWRMSLKFFLCSCHKYLLINFFSFGVVINIPSRLINSRHKHIITLRILGSKHDKVCQKNNPSFF